MINLQLAEKREVGQDGMIQVQGLPFYTIQGEGPHAGRPAVFVRLAGCNLQCQMCDTDYTSERRLVDARDLVIEIHKLHKDGLVVITGGEPLRQELRPLVEPLLEAFYDVQIETNGTLYDPSLFGIYGVIDIVCSPKTGSVNNELKPYITDLKYILREGYVDNDGLPTDSLGCSARPCRPWEGFEGVVRLQPVDEQDEERNKKNLEACVASCMKFGFTLSLQQHKILGLP